MRSTVGLDVIESFLSIWGKFAGRTSPATFLEVNDAAEEDVMVYTGIGVVQSRHADGKVTGSSGENQR